MRTRWGPPSSGNSESSSATVEYDGVESRERRRREIILSAMKVFIEKGIDNTSMEDLAKALGKTKSYFYFYFRSKEDLIISIFRYLKERALEEMEERLQGIEDPAERLEVWVREHFRQVRENPDFLRFVYSFVFSSMARRMDLIRNLNKRDRYFGLIQEIIEEGQREGKFVEGDAEAISYAIRGLIYGAMRYLFEGDGGIDRFQDVEDTVANLILRGILRRGG